VVFSFALKTTTPLIIKQDSLNDGMAATALESITGTPADHNSTVLTTLLFDSRLFYL